MEQVKAFVGNRLIQIPAHPDRDERSLPYAAENAETFFLNFQSEIGRLRVDPQSPFSKLDLRRAVLSDRRRGGAFRLQRAPPSKGAY